MGEVYRAHDPRLDRQVAIKLLPPETAADHAARQRLRLEAMAVAALDHPYICKIFEIGEDDDALFLVMEYVAWRHAGTPAEGRPTAAGGSPRLWPARSPRRSKKRTPAGFCTAI